MLLKSLKRPALGGLVLVLTASALTGCAWFRREPDYLSSTDSRPLEVPPDLVLPSSAGALQVPPAPAASGSMADTPPAAQVAGSAFVIDDGGESAFRRVGLALARIDGIEDTTAVAALNAYDVRAGGERFLVRLAADGENTRVDAISAEGAPLASPTALRVLGALRSRLQ